MCTSNSIDNCQLWLHYTNRHLPPMNNNGFIPSPSLNYTYLFNDTHQCLGIGTQTLIPLLQLELSHLVNLTRLNIV